jgi:5'-3' exoribonuclease 2
MFQYMRDNVGKDETVAVYGLDADLIMLSVFHCFSCKNIFIFRESPEFGKAYLEDNYARDECLYLDNRGLAGAILNEMGFHTETTESIGRIYDYIFACFLLGNDFLPHVPALNIRTHGNYTILETYRNVIARYPDRRFISLSSGNIQWRWVKVFLQELAKREHEYIRGEYEARHKMESRYYPTTTHEERTIAFDNIPTIYRAEEHYINPLEPGWERRYYRVAFHENITKSTMDELCNNYLEGLEWTFKYYTEGCPHWRWKYNYHYPPLITDLVKYIPDFETAFIDEKRGINRPFHPNTQLAYVIPRWNHSLLPKKMQKHLRQTNYVDLSELKFQWMFCRYFWESHALLPDISLTELEKLDELHSKI